MTDPQPSVPRRRVASATERRQWGYAPGLEGLRALAVTAVVIFHLRASWLPGGFLGVDVFFVLSGFLITLVLIDNLGTDGYAGLGSFYVRRARRLLPALFTMLAAVTLVTTVVERAQLHRLRGDVLAALTYCTNWTQIAWNRSYFAQLGPPSVLQHLWSLAVEEQFYLLWPLLLATCVGARHRFVSAVMAVSLAAASSLSMVVLAHPGQDPSRVYYGTDTHAAPLLMGAAMALLVGHRIGQAARTWARVCADVVAACALAALAYAAVHVDFMSDGLYRGDYPLIWLAACAVVLAAAMPGTATATVLGMATLRWVGERSYAIYLWHWPVLMLSRGRPGLPVDGAPLVVAQLVAIVIAADLSYRYVEHPIRTRGFLAALRGTTDARRHRRHEPRHGVPGRRAVVLALGLTGVGASVTVALTSAPSVPAAIAVDPGKQITITIPPDPGTAAVHGPPPAVDRTPHGFPTAAPRPPFRRPVHVAFFGDSQGMTLLLNKPNGLANSISLTDDTIEGCGVLLGTIHSSIGYDRDLSADCGNWAQVWAARAHAHPDIAVIEIGAWDVFDDTVNGVRLTFGSTAWDSYFTSQLGRGIDVLVKAGAQVALLGVPCYRPIAAGGLPRLPERGDDRRTRHVNALLRAAARSDPERVFMIHPPRQFCTDPAIATNTAYRWDGVHYYKPGAALMFQVITPQLLAIPQAATRRAGSH